MNRTFLLLILLLLLSCNNRGKGAREDIITVSIAPFGYFVRAIGGNDFRVNIMVPPGADPHVYEPVPGQVAALGNSVAYISNDYLDFELAWLGRFYEANSKMSRLSLADSIDLIGFAEHSHVAGKRHNEGGSVKTADPHYWISPKNAGIISRSIRDLLCTLKPENSKTYFSNYNKLSVIISEADSMAKENFKGFEGRAFMIFHPSLGYLARDYNIRQIAVETEGKEPSPADLRWLIDRAKDERIKTIFIQDGFDIKNATAIASETGARIVKIDPLSGDWYSSVTDIIRLIHDGFIKQESTE